jgi:hypothetical protein
MLRIAYALTVLSLIGASAVAGTDIENRTGRIGPGAGLVLLSSLQR